MDENSIPAMPLTLDELQVLARFLKTAFESEQTKDADKKILSKIKERIDRFAERQGAYWDRAGN